jgi:hypothetical protein
MRASEASIAERPAAARSFEDVLSGDHQHLERVFRALMARARLDDAAALRAAWARFEHELGWHLELEETEILPHFGREHPAEAEAIRAEHEQIRALVTELGVDLDLHCLRADRVEALGTLLQDHARREEALLYPWSDRQLPGAARDSLRGALERLMVWRLRPYLRRAIL